MVKRWGAVCLLLVASGLSGLGGLGLLEWVVRYREGRRTTVPGTMPFLYYRHDRLGHALVRGSDYFGWVHVNRNGFRGREISVAPRAGVIRIMIVGASTVMDGEVSRDENTWPARLEFWLNRGQSGRIFEVINAGVPGYRMIDNLIRLQTELYRYRPDLIVLYQAHNDLLAALAGAGEGSSGDEGARPGEVTAVAPWTHWLEEHSLLYNKVELRWQAIRSRQRGTARRQSTTRAPFDTAISAGADGFARDLTGFLALARALGIPVVIPEVVHMGGPSLARDSTKVNSVWRSAVPFAPPEILFAGYARFDSITQSVAAAHAVSYVPMAQSGLNSVGLYAQGDPVHFNDQGADRMGKMLAEALQQLSPWERLNTGGDHSRRSPQVP